MSGAILAAAVAVSAAAVQAQERILSFDLGLGPIVAPAYEGSDEYRLGATGTVGLDRLSFGSIDYQADPFGTGFSVAPSFRYIAARDSSDFAELAGIADNDAAVELGLRFGYDWQYARVFAAIRKGVTGHDGVVGEIGADAKIAASDRTRFTFGPRVSFGDDAYMSYAFDVPATATALAPYDADGGLRAYGIEARMRHEINDRTFLDATLSWERFADEAAASPIVKAGNRDQVEFGVMLVRRFQIRF